MNRATYARTALLVMSLGACSDDQASSTDTSPATDGGATDTAGTDGPPTTGATTLDPDDPGPEPPPAGQPDEDCDAGDEAFVKRIIPLLQGRRPEGMREVKLLASMIEQLDAMGKDGRAIVARGLASGDLYIARWKTFLWELLRINRIEIKSNPNCYSSKNAAAGDTALATFIRDNAALNSNFGQTFTMADVLESSLRLDDMSPVFRADMFARMARPLSGANISQEEFEVNARSNYGEIFESSYLGRRTGCLECHTSTESVTYDPDPKFNRFWAIPGDFESAIFGDPKGRPEDELFAAFRWTGFVVKDGITPWGMAGSCGRFDPGRNGDLLGVPGYLGGDLPAGQHVFDLDPLFKSGFKSLVDGGLVVGGDLAVAPDQALAFLTAANLANAAWKESLGYPLTLAHSFPRNEKQREILTELTDAALAEGMSLRAVLTEIVTHPYYNQDAPDRCTVANPYFLEPVFDPYSITANDPNLHGNGVGDRVQRHSAWVLIESAMRAMWWQLPIQQISVMDNDYPGIAFLRDQGIFLKDAISGFNGVDFNGLLSLEDQVATGNEKPLGGACTGPLGQGCAQYEWIELMLTEASKAPGTTVRHIAAAIKDRLITEPEIDGPAEEAVIAAIFGVAVDTPMNSIDTAALEAASRQFAGMLMTTPQFMLAGVPSRDQDPAAIPAFAAPGTDTKALCDYLAPQVLAGYAFTCSADGVKVGG